MLLWESNATTDPTGAEARRQCDRWGALEVGEVSLVHPRLTCCAAQVLTGLELVLIPGGGLGNPWDKTLKQRFHPLWQRDWKASEDDEPRILPPPAGCRNGVKSLGQRPGAGPFLLTSLFCRDFCMSPPRNLDMLVFCIRGALFISRDPGLRGLLLGGNVPTYIFPEVPACSLPSSQISPASPWCQPAPLISSWVWCRSPLCRLCTHQNKQTETQTHPSRLIVRELASMLAQPDEFR